MSQQQHAHHGHGGHGHGGHGHDDHAPGDEHHGESGVGEGVRGYLVGLFFAVLLTAASFYVASTDVIWKPGIPAALLVLAVAQMGVHLAFFLHITTGPDNTNNVLALAFGTLIVMLVIVGSIWIMHHLNANMMPASMMQMPGMSAPNAPPPLPMPNMR